MSFKFRNIKITRYIILKTNKNYLNVKTKLIIEKIDVEKICL